jgi:hypothetical protein
VRENEKLPDDLRDDPNHDEFVQRVAATLGALPPVNPAATAGILAAIEARRQQAGAPAVHAPVAHAPADARVVDLDAARRRRSAVPRFTVRALAGVGLAAAVGGFMVRGVTLGRGTPDAAAGAVAASPVERTGSAEPLTPVASSAASQRAMEAAALHAVPFMFSAPDARSVAVVGDFNGWDASSTPLHRDPSTGVWTALVPMPAGRHTYAFIVNDSVWKLDPRAARATDPDLGTQHSVLLVGAP